MCTYATRGSRGCAKGSIDLRSYFILVLLLEHPVMAPQVTLEEERDFLYYFDDRDSGFVRSNPQKACAHAHAHASAATAATAVNIHSGVRFTGGASTVSQKKIRYLHKKHIACHRNRKV